MFVSMTAPLILYRLRSCLANYLSVLQQRDNLSKADRIVVNHSYCQSKQVNAVWILTVDNVI